LVLVPELDGAELDVPELGVPELEEEVPPGPVSLVEKEQDARTSRMGTRRRTANLQRKGRAA